jgi:hypothetical protein
MARLHARVCSGYIKPDGSVLLVARCTKPGCNDQSLHFKLDEELPEILEEECSCGHTYFIHNDFRTEVINRRHELPLDEGLV